MFQLQRWIFKLRIGLFQLQRRIFKWWDWLFLVRHDYLLRIELLSFLNLCELLRNDELRLPVLLV